MKVICNQLRTINIEGIEFTPVAGGVTVPDDKIEEVRNSFFYKALVSDGSFVEVIAEVKEEEPTKKAKAK